MNRAAILHVQKSQYAFAYDAETLHIRLRAAKGDVGSAELLYAVKYDWTEGRRRVRMEKRCSDALFDYFFASVPASDSRIAYIFYLKSGEEAYYYSEEGLTKEYDYEKGYYNFFQYPYINVNDVHPLLPWCEDTVFYQIFVDRFRDGGGEKDRSYINRPWGALPARKSFYGGDLRGVSQKIGYLKELGVNAIYLTPVFASPSNHKYDIVDYEAVDPMFGTEEDLKALIASAHGCGMRVVLDAVFNHCSYLNPKFQDVLRRGKSSPYFDWFVVHGEEADVKKANYECFAACADMPKWNTNHPAVQDYLIGVALGWMQKCGADGWRLDVADEVSHDFWRKFRRAVKAENPQAILIGESWHDACAWLQGDQYDSIMNYSFTKACLDFFAFRTYGAQAFCDRLSEILMRNTDQVNEMMLNLLDSHDTERFLTNAGGDLKQLCNALAVLFFFPGMPCLYYGTEIGMEGGYDPDSRRTFDWNKEHRNGALSALVRRLTKLKREKIRGGVRMYVQGELFVMERGALTLLVNNTDRELSFSRDGERRFVKGQSHEILERG